MGVLEALARDLRFALRGLRRRPGFTLTTTATMALGIGSTVALFAVVDTVLLQPLPFSDQERLVVVWERDDTEPHFEVSWLNFRDWQAEASSFSAMTAMGSTTWGEIEIQRDPPLRLTQSTVSASFFDTLGVQPMLGRTFLPSDDGPDAPRVLVLGHGVWQQHFDGDPDVVGTAVAVGADSEPFTIVGVMPPAFQFPEGAQVWSPLGRAMAQIFADGDMNEDIQRRLSVLYVVGRLAPRVTQEQARTELDVIISSLWETYGTREQSRRSVVTPLTAYTFGNAETALYSLFGGVGLLLLITCANVSGLMVVRGQERRRMEAVQRALGITGGRLFRAQLVETAIITIVAATAGIALAALVIPVAIAVGPPNMPRLADTTVDGRAIALAIGLALACAVAMTLVAAPAARIRAITPWLRDGAPGTTAGRERSYARSMLIVSEVALALVLLVGAGLLATSYLTLAREDLGYRPGGVLTVNLTARDGAFPELEDRRQMYRRLLDVVRTVPGVTSAGAVYLLPFEYGVVGLDGRVILEGEDPQGPEPAARPAIAVQSITPGYFRAMGIDLVAGRAFDTRDVPDSPAAVIVSRALAAALWPGEDPIGQRLATGVTVGNELSDWPRVVGVVGDARYREIERARFNLYYPFYQKAINAQYLTVRTAGDPAALVGAVRDRIERTDPNLVVVATRPLTDIVARVMRPWRFNMTAAAAFAAIAVGLAGFGLFGTVAYGVAQRTREIGVRRALGAQAGDVLALVWRYAIVLTLCGTAVGVFLSLAVGEALRPLLFGVAPHDPVTLVGVGVLVVGICAAASLAAALRATRIDPILALRAE